jgi:hypothetical protein
LIVEFQAVEHGWSFGQAKDVVGQQVGVPVDYSPVSDPLGEQDSAARYELGGEPFCFMDRLSRDHGVGIWLQFHHVLLPLPQDCLYGALSIDRRSPRRATMEPRQYSCNRGDVLVHRFAAFDD